jgi:benzoate/toluate 1,2-dioxygenase subunit alpha
MNRPFDPAGVPATRIAGLVEPDRVHRRVYVDPAVFALEMQRVFGAGWVFVAHESEVPAPGDFKTDRIGPLNFLLVRGADGQVRAFHNVCPHRGAKLCHAPYGQARGFQCMYHGWSFDLAGALEGMPLRERFQNFDAAEYGLVPIPRLEGHRGFLFASLNPQVMPLPQYLGRAAHYLDLMVDRAPEGEIEAVRPVKYHYPGNWKLQLENYAENYHPAVLHGSALQVGVQVLREKFGDSAFTMREASARYIERALPHGHAMSDYAGTRGAIWLNAYNDEYVAQLAARHGAERARAMRDMDLHMIVYPNLLLHVRQNHYRVIKPLRVDYTEVNAYPCRLKGAPDAVNERLIHNTAHHVSAVGEVQVDDMQAFRWVQEGLSCGGVDWVALKLTGEEEHVNADGELEWYGASEAMLRGQYEQWRALMTAEQPA